MAVVFAATTFLTDCTQVPSLDETTGSTNGPTRRWTCADVDLAALPQSSQNAPRFHRTSVRCRFSSSASVSQSASARPELQRLRDVAKIAIGGELSRQDNKRWKPHVTIQNEVPVETAPRFHRILENGFIERRQRGDGIS
ncbi:hypothetical protein [Afipia sp. DC4300-2b1]|uniref:hypothetical protein n=1 Tax=Afipia sp. DC4300-2b1 TaxID=2804672 RepID=UPI003CF847E3